MEYGLSVSSRRGASLDQPAAFSELNSTVATRRTVCALMHTVRDAHQGRRVLGGRPRGRPVDGCGGLGTTSTNCGSGRKLATHASISLRRYRRFRPIFTGLGNPGGAGFRPYAQFVTVAELNEIKAATSLIIKSNCIPKIPRVEIRAISVTGRFTLHGGRRRQASKPARPRALAILEDDRGDQGVRHAQFSTHRSRQTPRKMSAPEQIEGIGKQPPLIPVLQPELRQNSSCSSTNPHWSH